jgi:hypothetical protein
MRHGRRKSRRKPGEDAGSDAQSGLTGVPFLDDMAMRVARLQGSFIGAPLGPSRALRPDGESGGPGVTDVSGVINFDPLAPYAEIYEGRGRRRRFAGAAPNVGYPGGEALYPDTGSDEGGGGSETVIIQRFLADKQRRG